MKIMLYMKNEFSVFFLIIFILVLCFLFKIIIALNNHDRDVHEIEI